MMFVRLALIGAIALSVSGLPLMNGRHAGPTDIPSTGKAISQAGSEDSITGQVNGSLSLNGLNNSTGLASNASESTSDKHAHLHGGKKGALRGGSLSMNSLKASQALNSTDNCNGLAGNSTDINNGTLVNSTNIATSIMANATDSGQGLNCSNITVASSSVDISGPEETAVASAADGLATDTPTDNTGNSTNSTDSAGGQGANHHGAHNGAKKGKSQSPEPSCAVAASEAASGGTAPSEAADTPLPSSTDIANSTLSLDPVSNVESAVSSTAPSPAGPASKDVGSSKGRAPSPQHAPSVRRANGRRILNSRLN